MPKTFVREATGLVREVGTWDYALTNMNGVGLFLALTLTPWFIFYAVPGGDVIVGSIGGLIFSLFGTIVVFAITSATFPRSAAPYVTQSRVLHPAIGWPSEVVDWISYGPIGISVGLGSTMLSWGVVAGIYSMGVSTGNTGLVSAAFALTQPTSLFVVNAVAILLTMGITMVGTRALVRKFQWPMTILGAIGVLILIVIWSTSNLAQLQAALPKYTGETYAQIMQYATTNYPRVMVPVSYAAFPVLNSIALTVGSFNTYWAAWGVGEVKHANSVKMNYLSMAIPSIVLFILTVSTIGLAQMAVGRNFLVAMTQILSNNPGFLSKVPSVAGFATVSFVPMMLADNPILQFFLTIGIAGGVLASSVYIWIIITRDFFAWSFDRILPAKFASVSDRTHTPVFNIAVNAAIAIVFAFFISYGFGSSILGYVFTSTFTMSVMSVGLLMLAGILLPLRKHLWSLSPANKLKVVGIPLICIGGILGFFYQFAAVYFYVSLAAFGFGRGAAEVLISAMLIPFILYWIIRSIRIAQGIDIDLIFKTIPPE